MTPEEVAATGRSKRGYYIGVIDARAVRAMGLSLMVDDEDPAHVSIAEINSANAGTDETYELAKRLSEVCKVVRNERFPGTPGANP
jgi:hypothetical protein